MKGIETAIVGQRNQKGNSPGKTRRNPSETGEIARVRNPKQAPPVSRPTPTLNPSPRSAHYAANAFLAHRFLQHPRPPIPEPLSELL